MLVSAKKNVLEMIQYHRDKVSRKKLHQWGAVSSFYFQVSVTLVSNEFLSRDPFLQIQA